MYDPLYAVFDSVDVDVVVHADHPTLNRQVADLLSRGERVDVLSTHSKYAPSQAQWLQPLNVDTAALAPKAVELCRWQGEQICVPRNIDVRVLWYRSDLLAAPPASWNDVVVAPASFGFPGRESGLFGTFFELVTSAGGRLFDDDARPTMASDEAVAAVETLCALAAKAPADLPDWHYDQVDDALLEGRVGMAAAWPGGYGRIRRSELYRTLDVAPYPGGVSYAGAHAWAVPTTCGDVPAAVALIERLVGADANRVDAAAGTVCAHVDAFADVVAHDDKDAARLAITRDTIANAMITYPPLARFPEVEDAGWSAINAAMRGEHDAKNAVLAIQRAAEAVLDGD
jgi:multiple sugar transport system substrate-binding protein